MNNRDGSSIGHLGRTLAAQITAMRADLAHQREMLESIDTAITELYREVRNSLDIQLSRHRRTGKQTEEVWSPSDITAD
jgi:hypothetical protein